MLMGAATGAAASLGADGQAEAELVILLLVVQLPGEQQVDLGVGSEARGEDLEVGLGGEARRSQAPKDTAG